MYVYEAYSAFIWQTIEVVINVNYYIQINRI